MNNLRNVPLKLFRDFLLYKGLKIIRTNGGHEIWGGQVLKRPIIIQTHINPVPEFIIKNNLRNMGLNVKDFLEFVNSK